MASMWSKDNDNVPDLFAKLSTDSCVRSKKDHSTETLPVFSEELWKTAVPLPTQPSLWAPIVKPTGLWNAPTYNAITTPISLQQIALERKKAQKLLWSRKTARRTTEAEPERTKVAIRQLDLPLVVVSGSLWNKAKPAADIGLWKRRVRSKTVASDTIPPAVPLWAKETARRTTKLAPERGVAVKKISNITLSVVSGSLWTKKEEKDEEPSLWNKSLNSPETPPQLWSQDTVIRTQVPKKPEFERIENILPLDSTSLWVPPSPEPHKSLWKPQQMPPTPTESPSNEESSPAPLWTKSTARRQTDKVPQRVAPAPRKSSVVLEKASGTMWGQQDEPLSPMSMGGLSRASTISTASTVSASEEVLDDIPVHVRAAHSTKNSISSVLGSVAPPTITKVGLWAPASPQEKEKSRA
ncbi:hypothetical protein EDC01DRAFT_656512 [Geopyxis carbonaria]|nr:hypothetical protein EDC01DRAFT_656512 [Geopyxis carbonaria]